ncbi:MAG: 5-carboxymethyl-2-hydroxymuconate isomerase [Ideonella sp.]|jgi:5-carboxymethyl-2-hydroxymuconate isomerase|nr:5-carboxymethyl-2-hydroxymuconate isomerase [Ideonella sp.]
MPHLVILYTPQLDAETDMSALCRQLADAMITVKDEAGAAVFPVGGVRVLAYPAAHHAVADGGAAARAAGNPPGAAPGGHADCAFAYFNLRMGRGRSEAVKKQAGELLAQTARQHLAPVLARRAIGLTLQIDEGPEVFDAKFGNLHSLFAKP